MTMEFTALFLAVTVVMVVAWWGTRTLALGRVPINPVL
jgi:hypothetical protein